MKHSDLIRTAKVQQPTHRHHTGAVMRILMDLARRPTFVRHQARILMAINAIENETVDSTHAAFSV